MNDFFTALALLTIVPSPVHWFDVTRASGKSLAWFPVVGVGLGLTLSLALYFFRALFSNPVAASLLVALWAMLTGALHLDGISDACDGLFAATTRERRLEILRDVHLGTFGAVGLMLVLITKVASVASAPTVAPIFLAPVLGRWALVYAATYPTARSEGMAVMFRAGLTRRVIFVATILAALIAAIFGGFGLVAFVTAFTIATLIARFALNRLGGLTGDLYGMICESVEVGVLIVGGLSF